MVSPTNINWVQAVWRQRESCWRSTSVSMICHSNCHFYCIFGTSSPRTTIWCENCKKIPNIEGKNKYLVFVSYHRAISESGWPKKSQATKWIQVSSSISNNSVWVFQPALCVRPHKETTQRDHTKRLHNETTQRDHTKRPHKETTQKGHTKRRIITDYIPTGPSVRLGDNNGVPPVVN